MFTIVGKSFVYINYLWVDDNSLSLIDDAYFTFTALSAVPQEVVPITVSTTRHSNAYGVYCPYTMVLLLIIIIIITKNYYNIGFAHKNYYYA